MESHLERLTGNMDRTLDQEDHSSNQSSRQASLGHHDFDDNDDDDDNNNENDDDNMSESPSSLLTVKSTGTHIFRSRVDMVDRYYGPSSLFGLCNGFRLRASAASGMIEPSDSLEEMLESICKIAGTTEHFPAYSDQSLNDLLPKQQTLAAVDKFFQHVDSSTDLFVQSSLLSNLERVYSQPMKSRDETWAICLKTIILLVLGNEMSTQANNALFGDFALSFLPSRAALVNSRLLTVPRLINVQTLILLVRFLLLTIVRHGFLTTLPRVLQRNGLIPMGGQSFSLPMLVCLQKQWGSITFIFHLLILVQTRG